MSDDPGGSKVILQPRITIVNAYSLIAALYCSASAILFYSVVQSNFLAIIHLLALFSVLTNYFVLIQTKNFKLATTIILTTGTTVVVSLFATGGWAGTGYLWPFAYLPFAFFLAERSVILNWVAALFIGCLVAVFLHLAGVITVPYSFIAIINYFAALIVFTVCIFLFQQATVKREEFLTYTDTLLETAPDAVIVIDEEGKIVKWNYKSFVLFGWTASEVMYKPLSEIIIPHRYREAHKNGLKHFLKTGKGAVLGKTIEIQAIKKNNIEFDVALSISPTLINDKRLFIGFIRDITERKEGEKKLLNLSRELEQRVVERTEELGMTEKRYRYLFENNPMPMWVIDLNTFKFRDVNEMAVRHYGYSREEFLSMTALDIRPDEDKELFRGADHLFDMSSTNNKRGIWNHRKKDGTIIQVEIIAHPIIFEGIPARFVLANDVTEKIKAEEKLNKSEKLFRAMIEKDADMKTLATPDGKVFYASPSLTQVLGYSNEEFMNTPAFELIHPDDVPGLIEGVTDIIQTPGKSFYRQQRLKHKNGTWIWCEGTITNMLHDPLVGALVSNFRDITKRKEAEEKLKKSEKLFRSIALNIPKSLVILMDKDHKFLMIEGDIMERLGYKRQDYEGKHPLEVSSKEQYETSKPLYERVFKGEQFSIERSSPLGDFIVHFVPMKDEKDSVESAMIIALDISESKKAEKNLERSLKEISDYKYALEESSIVAITDQKGIITYANDNFCKISKYSREELIGQDHRIINSGHHSKEFIKNIWTTIANGRVWRGELKNKAKDESIYWVDTTIVPFLNEQNKPYQYVAIRADITDRKKVEENLEKSLREVTDYKYALEESSIVAITDQKGIITYANDNFCKISKYSREELIGKDHRIINSGHHSKEFIKNIWTTIANGKIWRGELKNKAKDGTVYWVDTTIVPFLNEQNKPYQYVAIRADITDRKKVEEDLEKSLREITDYKYAIEESSIVAITDQKGIILHANDNFCKISKYSREELIGQDHRIVNSGFHSKEFIRNLWTTIANGKIWRGEIKNKAKDGTTYWVDTTIVPFLNEKGKPYQYIAIRAEITERKRLEEFMIANEELGFQIEEKEKRAAELIIANKELIFQNLEKEKRAAELIIANKELAFQSEEKEKRAAELIVANDELLFQNQEKEKRASELIIANKELAFQSNEKEKRASELIVANEELVFQNEEKEKRAAELIVANKELGFQSEEKEKRAAELLIANKELLFQNDEKGKRAAELSETLERVSFLASIADNIQDPVISTDNPGNDNFIITRWNKPAEKLLEWKSEEVIGKNAMKVFKTDYPNENREQIFELLKTKGFWQGEVIYHTKSGRPVYVLSTISYLKDAEGNITGNLVLIRDITKRKIAEEDLLAANKELESFSYSVSHDLRAPLRAVNGYARMLEEDYGSLFNKEGKRLLGEVQQNAMKMGTLIDDLLDFSRLGRKEVKRSKVNMNELIEGVLSEIRQSIPHHAVIKFNDLEPIMADYSLIKHVIINLLSNAIKYSSKKEKPVVEIASKKENGEVIYSIKDNGAGFDMQYVNKLFGVFQRLHSSEEFPGTGVGLAIVHRIIQKHDGKIWAESKVNKGATFFFSLPDVK